MKYIVTESQYRLLFEKNSNPVIEEQNENRIIKMIKDFVNDYKEGRLVRTECDVDYDPKNKVYIITPTFYVKKKENFPYMIFKHSLSDRIDDYLGITTHILKPIVKEI